MDIYGYQKREYGWVRDNPKGTSQAVTTSWDEVMNEASVQMFGWYTKGPDVPDYKIFDTGWIGLENVHQFEILLEVFDQYKHIDG